MVMIAYRTETLDGMVMAEIGDMLIPVAAGPSRGPRFARLLQKPADRMATRFIAGRPAHPLDIRPASTNKSGRGSSSVTVNVYARTRLKVSLRPGKLRVSGEPFEAVIHSDLVHGSMATSRAFARLRRRPRTGAATGTWDRWIKDRPAVLRETRHSTVRSGEAGGGARAHRPCSRRRGARGLPLRQPVACAHRETSIPGL
jgi:hypothetical protein